MQTFFIIIMVSFLWVILGFLLFSPMQSLGEIVYPLLFPVNSFCILFIFLTCGCIGLKKQGVKQTVIHFWGVACFLINQLAILVLYFLFHSSFSIFSHYFRMCIYIVHSTKDISLMYTHVECTIALTSL